MERLLRETLRVWIVRQHLRQLVAEHRDAARLDADDRHAGPDRAPQDTKRSLEVAAGEAQEAVVVERAPAADVPARHDHAKTGVLEHLNGRGPDLRLEVVREGVRPEDDRPRGRRRGCTLARPGLER